MNKKTKDPYSYHLVEDNLDLSTKDLEKLLLKLHIKIANLIYGKKKDRQDLRLFIPARLKSRIKIDVPCQLVYKDVIALISKN